ncbi:MAG: SDR family oxidoreductase [Isosphaeraceae bacterium]
MRIVVTGASGQLGCYLLNELTKSGAHVVIPWSGKPRSKSFGLHLRPVNLTEPAAVSAALVDADPEVILHAAAVSAPYAVRQNPEKGWGVNVEGTARLAEWCRSHGRRLIFTSTDMVFDGERGWYREQDLPRPVLEYGRTKAAAETVVLGVPHGLVARISLLYGPSRIGRGSFFDRAIASLEEGKTQTFFEDEFRTPLDYATAARALIRLAETDVRGIVHVGGRERLSRFQLMQRAARALGLDASLVRANRRADVVFTEPRPADLSLCTELLDSLLPNLERPSIEEALRGGDG